MTLRTTGLLHYALEIPDMAIGRDFYDSFGLEVDDTDDLVRVRCAGRVQDRTLLLEGPQKRLHHVAFAIPTGSAREFQRRLEGLDVALIDSPVPERPGGLWFRDPDGNLVQLAEEALAPDRAAQPTPALNMGGDYQRTDVAAWLDAESSLAKPRRLGHMLVFSSDNDRSERFYRDAIGLQLADKTNVATFMHAGPGDHHVFGFVHDTHPGLHHSSWEVDTLDQMGMGARTMVDKGYDMGWGLGRHTLGSNLFHYVRDPWGSWIEYFADIDQITDEWVAKEWDDLPAAIWCPMMPREFIENHEQPSR